MQNSRSPFETRRALKPPSRSITARRQKKFAKAAKPISIETLLIKMASRVHQLGDARALSDRHIDMTGEHVGLGVVEPVGSSLQPVARRAAVRVRHGNDLPPSLRERAIASRVRSARGLRRCGLDQPRDGASLDQRRRAVARAVVADEDLVLRRSERLAFQSGKEAPDALLGVARGHDDRYARPRHVLLRPSPPALGGRWVGGHSVGSLATQRVG